MQAPRASTAARPLCRLAASLAIFSTLLACGYKGPLYMPPPPPPEESLTTPPRPAGAPETGSANNNDNGGAASTSPVRAQ
ncbi:LPS translocon maturation chaperone LptM [Pollutimonas nitritireducens]|uniref:LPS translocon maturation chaperone LptM n=1 Tax=Pollutimonas nitritireducens TaxID=2045209 RepID=UPI00117E2630|nr:lipoprotein [Pollutimonas nitritireducens]